MALVAKNDVTQIFAIQAPSVDLPPTFANYPRGWDTARSNNGKPTIKQFNYIQQRTDQNMLWIHQNGAALPYDATMEYAENAHVVKDGVLQKKQGAAWVNVSVKTDSELNTWSGRTQEAKNKDFVSVLDYGAKGNGVADDTASIRAAIATGKSVFFPDPDNFYNITNEIGPKFPGQILFSNCRKRGFIRNVTNSNRLAVVGDPSRTDGAAPQAGFRSMYFFGNPNTIGGIAQEVISAFEAQGLNAFEYGIVCFDEWEATEEIEAGSRYAIRYDELAMFIFAAI